MFERVYPIVIVVLCAVGLTAGGWLMVEHRQPGAPYRPSVTPSPYQWPEPCPWMPEEGGC